MLVPTPWKDTRGWLWQLLQVVETYAWPAGFSTGVVLTLKPPVTKVDAWQLLQTDEAFVVMWLLADVTAAPPSHVFPGAWQVLQLRLATAA